MPYTKEVLQNMYSLSPEDVLATLTACGLPHDASEYADADIENRFDIVRQLLKDEQASNYEEATRLLQQRLESNSLPDTATTNTEVKNKIRPTKSLNIAKLLSFASKQGFKLKLSEALKILESCGLKEQDEYTPQEVERFIEACQSIGQQTSTSNVYVDIEDITIETESDLTGMVDKVTDRFVEKIPRGLVRQVYTKKAIARLAELPEEGEDFLKEMEKQILARIEGKPSPMQLLLQKHQLKFLPHTPTNSMQLPSASENDSTTS
ncbi:hypothetical protein LC593_30160 [Nostoc sp. CHAB 5844]|nr:hypothetical protein [Nostoc sp. CHAB 5844]